MKSRYIFYLLCFLICIEWTFCYEVITNDALNLPARQIHKKLKTRHRRNKVRNRSRRQQPWDHLVDHLDVASFIQQPDMDLRVDQQNGHFDRSRQRSRTSNEYSEYETSNANEDIAPENDVAEKKHGYYEFLEKSPTNKPSRLQNQNFPFFSHDHQADKKKKKRKLFGFRSKTTLGNTHKPDMNRLRFRRSNIFCSSCKKKSTKETKNNNIKENSSTILHNSRQFYLLNGDLEKSKQKSLVVELPDCRVRRNHNTNMQAKNTKDNQPTTLKKYLHEIDELEQQIDNLPSLPHRKYEKNELLLSESIAHTTKNNNEVNKNSKKRTKRLQDNFLSLERKEDVTKMRQFQELREIERKVNRVRIEGYPNLDTTTHINGFDNH